MGLSRDYLTLELSIRKDDRSCQPVRRQEALDSGNDMHFKEFPDTMVTKIS